MMHHVLEVRNVCEALPRSVEFLLNRGVREETRAGPAFVAPGPVLTVTQRPTERVLFSALRDANPFFHLVEAVWMLAGRDDAAMLNRYVSDFGERFGEAGGVIHGAYGHRWRHALGFDQLDVVVERLRKNPQDRQCVIQMWDGVPGEGFPGWESHGAGREGCNDLVGDWKDRPCNTHVYLRVRLERPLPPITGPGDRTTVPGVLDLTVCCRSNDNLWGAHGANAVHFSVLQEYLAARIGVGVGTMYQFSNNYHMYVAPFEAMRRKLHGDTYGEIGEIDQDVVACLRDDRHQNQPEYPTPMFTAPGAADEDIRNFCAWHDAGCVDAKRPPVFWNTWFRDVLYPAVLSHDAWRRSKSAAAGGLGETKMALENDALMLAKTIGDYGWRAACSEWLQRRIKR